MNRTATDRLRPLAVPLALAVGFLIVVSRKPGATSQPSFWAEDGAVFFLGQHTVGFEPLGPYQSQVWLLQRLLALGLGWLGSPVSAATAYYLLSAGVTVAAMAVLLLQRSADVFGQLPYRIAAFCTLLVLPGVWEVHGNLANLHVWATVSVMICLTLAPPASGWGRAMELAWVAVTALSGFSAVILLPIALWAMRRHAGRYPRVRSGLVLVAALLAIGVWLFGDRPATPPSDYLDRLRTVGQSVLGRVGGTLVRGEEPLDGFIWAWAAALVLLTVLLLTVIDRRGPSPYWLACGTTWLLLGAMSQPPSGVGGLLIPFVHGRYFTLLLAASVLVLCRTLATRSGFVLRGAALLTLLLVWTGAFLDYQLATPRGLTQDEVDTYQRCIEARDPQCQVPVRPEGWIRPATRAPS